MTTPRYLLLLVTLFCIEFAVLAIAPHDRSDWALENALAVLFVVALVVSYRRFALSKLSYTLIFLFLCLHEVGAHYTYARVPYDAFMQRYFDFSPDALLGWQRNQFDRVVHFAYGLLLAYPAREIYCRVAGTKGFWGYFFPLTLMMATSMLFELFEWAAAELFGGDLGIAYLGTQGDVWDAHKDMALASLGALLAMLLVMVINRAMQKNFRGEWRESLRIKHRQPLGEEEIKRLLAER